MATRKAKVLYDFDAQPGTGEISVKEGELVQITKTDVGEGWWEGTNLRGETGLFPEAYVEELMAAAVESGPPAMAPPPLPQDYNLPAATTAQQPVFASPTAMLDEWSADPWTVPPQTTAHQLQLPPIGGGGVAVPQHPQQQQSDWADDDFDSDFDDESVSQVGSSAQQQYPNLVAQGYGGGGGQLGLPPGGLGSNQGGSSGDLSSVGGNGGRSESWKKNSNSSAASSKTSFNRFSMFVKSGSENFILGKITGIQVVPGEQIHVVVGVDERRFRWQTVGHAYSCVVASPKKDTKFKGLKSFIAYQLTPSFNNIQVSRRYKHFDWLYERLTNKYNFIPIPPLPDKQIQGRYEEEFIEHRMNQLQSFVDRMCRHPILSQCEVWKHFLTCTDDKKWKLGKRRAEKDPLVCGASFLALTVPERTLDATFIDTEVQNFAHFSGLFDAAVKNLAKVGAEQTTKFQNDYRRDLHTMGRAFSQLGQAMTEANGSGGSGDTSGSGDLYSPGLNTAIINTGEVYEEIGKLYEEQPRLDWERLADMMHDYKGLLSGFPQILHIHSGAQGKHREVEADAKVGPAEMAEVKRRTDTVSYALLAEINTFHEQRVKDLKAAHQQFLQEQIKFYQKITEKLQENLRLYDQC